jgi:hypothetical protein
VDHGASGAIQVFWKLKVGRLPDIGEAHKVVEIADHGHAAQIEAALRRERVRVPRERLVARGWRSGDNRHMHTDTILDELQPRLRLRRKETRA